MRGADARLDHREHATRLAADISPLIRDISHRHPGGDGGHRYDGTSICELGGLMRPGIDSPEYGGELRPELRQGQTKC